MQDKSTKNQSTTTTTTTRSTKNRRRSKKRSIFCKIHRCHLESESPKYRLSKLKAKNTQDKEELNEFLLSLSGKQNSEDVQTTWIEAFRCPQCEKNVGIISLKQRYALMTQQQYPIVFVHS